ncbi:MAG TPA: biotin/lipoate A/B protein ligase family protein [Oscillatoriaceae cyanobacterium]
MTRFRLLDTGTADGDWNMALDEALLEGHRLGISPSTLRFTAWKRPTLSLGYAQKLEGVNLAACRAHGVAIVRRPTGGRAVLHAGDFTYAFVGSGLPESVAASYRVLAGAIAQSLAWLGLESTLAAGTASRSRPVDCFAVATQADLCAAGAKLVGSAQTRRAGAVLQHGSLYLRYPAALGEAIFGSGPAIGDLASRLEAMPALDAIKDAFRRGFAEVLGAAWEPGEVSAWELERIEAMRKGYRVGIFGWPGVAPAPDCPA